MMNPFRILLVLFIAIPLLEIYLFIKVGEVIGAWPTVLAIVLTAVIGVALLRHQGLSTMSRFQQQVQCGELPATTMLEGMMLVIAGALLLTPGFFTDAVGFLLLVPFARLAIINKVVGAGMWQVYSQHHTTYGGNTYQHEERHQHTIEGEYKSKDDK